MARLHRAVPATKVFPIIGTDAPKRPPGYLLRRDPIHQQRRRPGSIRKPGHWQSHSPCRKSSCDRNTGRTHCVTGRETVLQGAPSEAPVTGNQFVMASRSSLSTFALWKFTLHVRRNSRRSSRPAKMLSSLPCDSHQSRMNHFCSTFGGAAKPCELAHTAICTRLMSCSFLRLFCT